VYLVGVLSGLRLLDCSCPPLRVTDTCIEMTHQRILTDASRKLKFLGFVL
jgi:hypothetical protein